MISIIVAMSENNVIGKDNQLIWKQSDDLKRFKELTSGKPVIMGRKTYDSIGRPLPNRLNIVVSRNKDLMIEGCIVVDDLGKAFKKAGYDKEVFIIGGSSIYKEAFKYASEIYLTMIHTEVKGDTYFYPESTILREFEETSREHNYSDENNEYNYSFINYKRI
ncbi:MAG: dihydrofolate reductase [uncultured marine phage]|uniref:dihydrofolate reductase n=1 Tax=uncultured marine phage TaxID=707152 RepID=A0A8D9FQU9_9VIRU|nr:MAG: dihydrofolate reductase [uncultured marine phage]